MSDPLNDKIEERDEERRPPPADKSWLKTVPVRDAPGAGFQLGIFVVGLLLIGALFFAIVTRP